MKKYIAICGVVLVIGGICAAIGMFIINPPNPETDVMIEIPLDHANKRAILR